MDDIEAESVKLNFEWGIEGKEPYELGEVKSSYEPTGAKVKKLIGIELENLISSDFHKVSFWDYLNVQKENKNKEYLVNLIYTRLIATNELTDQNYVSFVQATVSFMFDLLLFAEEDGSKVVISDDNFKDRSVLWSEAEQEEIREIVLFDIIKTKTEDSLFVDSIYGVARISNILEQELNDIKTYYAARLTGEETSQRDDSWRILYIDELDNKISYPDGEIINSSYMSYAINNSIDKTYLNAISEVLYELQVFNFNDELQKQEAVRVVGVWISFLKNEYSEDSEETLTYTQIKTLTTAFIEQRTCWKDYLRDTEKETLEEERIDEYNAMIATIDAEKILLEALDEGTLDFVKPRTCALAALILNTMRDREYLQDDSDNPQKALLELLNSFQKDARLNSPNKEEWDSLKADVIAEILNHIETNDKISTF